MTGQSTAKPLVETKLLAPRLRPNCVDRVRLRQRLSESRHAVLVSAPAGSGKSVLLADWASTCGDRVAWLSLEPADDDVLRFVNYLLAALRRAEITTWSEALDGRVVTAPDVLQGILTDLLNEVATGNRSGTLILDDFHVIESPAIHQMIQFLMDHLPPGLRLVISTRSDPPLSFSRLRASNILTEIREEDLRFSIDEAASFLKGTMGLPLDDREVAEVERRTEGWAVGLQIAALSLQGKSNVGELVTRFTGSNRYVLDYLTDEVIAAQAEDVREFLIRTSILDRLSAELCDALCDRSDSGTVLKSIESANLFLIPLDDEGSWYRYHHLFATVLQHHLQRAHDAAFIAGLHQRASDWYMENGSADLAMRHAMAIRDKERIRRIMKLSALPLALIGDWTTLRQWLGTIPDTERWNDVDILVVEAAEAIERFHLDTAERSVGRAEELIEESTPSYTRAVVLLLRGMLLRFSSQLPESLEAIEAAYRAAEADGPIRTIIAAEIMAGVLAKGDLARAVEVFADLHEEQTVPPRSLFLVLAYSNFASDCLRRGEPDQTISLSQDCIRWIEHWDREDHRGQAHASFFYALQSETSRLRNDLSSARSLAEYGVTLGRRGGSSAGLLESLLALIKVSAADRNWAELDRLRRELPRIHRSDSRPVVFAEASDWIIYDAILRRGQQTGSAADIEMVSDAVARAGLDNPPFRVAERDLPAFFLCDPPLVAARLKIAQGRTENAIALLDETVEYVRRRGRVLSLVKALILRAISSLDVDVMQEALETASRPRFVRPFVEEGEAEALIIKAIPRIRDRMFAAQIVDALQIRNADTELLSAREIEVLRLIASGASNRDAAEKLFVSPYTVKKHLENIYGKLGVSGRTQALKRARELALLS